MNPTAKTLAGLAAFGAVAVLISLGGVGLARAAWLWGETLGPHGEPLASAVRSLALAFGWIAATGAVVQALLVLGYGLRAAAAREPEAG